MTVVEAIRLLEGGRRFHFVGIAGAGMSALAEILLARGHAVTGCDLNPEIVAERLEALGAEVRRGHSPDHLEPDAAVVVSSAIPATEPEVALARERGQPIVRRAELLAALMAGTKGIAVAGTHGKSTTTTMVGAVFEAAGRDPTVVVGGRIRGAAGNVRIGGGAWMVAEADEFDRSFLALSPAHTVITNIEADHLDTYVTAEEYHAAFAEFVGRVDEGGVVALGIDDPGARRLAVPPGRQAVTFGLDPRADVRARALSGSGLAMRFTLELEGRTAGDVALAMPGRHNVRNALAAAAVAWRLGIDPVEIRAGLSAVRGVERRFEIVHADEHVTIVDDYAHHPTEIAATLAGAREAWPERRLVAVFQPHLYSRTRDFAAAFGEALTEADVVFVTDVYPAREKPIQGVTGELVSEAARASGAADVTFLPDPDDVGRVAERIRPGDVVVTLGAGDIDRLARRLAGAPARPGATSDGGRA